MMKKLIPALCMLMVAAALLGTSTFAWFSMNTEVEANGMSVQAATSANLVIKNSTASTWSRAADATYAGTQTLMPASTSLTAGVLSAGKFFYVSNTEDIDYDTGAADANTVFEAVPVTANEENDYVSANTFTIAVEGDKTFTNLYVSEITVSSSANAISKALRVAVVTDAHAYIFAPVAGHTDNYKGVKAAATGTDAALSTTAETLTSVGTSATLGSISDAAEVDVTIYVWYEGQDENCISGNAINVEELSVGVHFIAVD